MGFDVGDSSSEEDGENPNEPPDDGIPPQGSTAPWCGAGGARGRRRGPWGGSQTVAAKGTKRKWDKTGTWAAVENSIGIMRNLTKAELDTMLLQIPATTRHDQADVLMNGSTCQGRWADGNAWYDGLITSGPAQDGSFDIAYEDGDNATPKIARSCPSGC